MDTQLNRVNVTFVPETYLELCRAFSENNLRFLV